MDLYTIDDLENDILHVEGVKVKCKDITGECRFLKLYSDVFSKRLSDSATVNDIQIRINEFLRKEDVLVPPCDVWPDDENAIEMYHCTKENGVDYLKHIGSYKSVDVLADSSLINEEFKEKYKSIAIIATRSREVMYYDLEIH